MGDIVFVAATIAFFVICVLYVNWCDRIIGADDFSESIDDPAEADDEIAVAA